MSDALSISLAALAAPEALALVTKEGEYSYQQLAQLVREYTIPGSSIFQASARLSTVVEFYAHLEAERCITYLPAGTSVEEDQELSSRVPRHQPDIALTLFTSGSKGTPKGVQLSRAALVASAEGSLRCIPWVGNDRWLCVLPLSHIGGLSILSRCLQSQKAVILCPNFEAQEVADSIVRNRVTHISLVPTMLWRLLEIGFSPPDHLAVCLVGGAALAPSLGVRAKEAGFRLRLTYGMTECASQVITDGVPLPGVELRVRDHQLEILGPILMNAYLEPDAPGLQHDGWFRTNDTARIAEDGSVEILGRSDDTVISGGENIDPRRIENALLTHVRVQQAFAFGLPHQEWGQELIALVVCEGAILPENLSEACGLLGHQNPKAMVLVDSLPLLRNGKIDRAKARRIARAWRSNKYPGATEPT